MNTFFQAVFRRQALRLAKSSSSSSASTSADANESLDDKRIISVDLRTAAEMMSRSRWETERSASQHSNHTGEHDHSAPVAAVQTGQPSPQRPVHIHRDIATAESEPPPVVIEEVSDSNKEHLTTDQWMTNLEEVCAELQFSDAKLLQELQSGRIPNSVVKRLLEKGKTGLSEKEIQQALERQRRDLIRKLEEARRKAEEEKRKAAELKKKLEAEKKRTRRMWVCSWCHNSNPGCPYRPTQSGGYFIDVPDQ